MFIEFTKEHPAGIKKGHHSNESERTAKIFIEKGFAKETTEEAFEAFKKIFVANDTKEAKRVAKEAEKHNKKRAETVARELNPRAFDKQEETEEEEVKTEEVKFHTLTEEDLEAHPSETLGMQVGTEVEMNSEEALIINDEGLFVEKGNV